MTYPPSELHDLEAREQLTRQTTMLLNHYKSLRAYYRIMAEHIHSSLTPCKDKHTTNSFMTCENELCKDFVHGWLITELK